MTVALEYVGPGRRSKYTLCGTKYTLCGTRSRLRSSFQLVTFFISAGRKCAVSLTMKSNTTQMSNTANITFVKTNNENDFWLIPSIVGELTPSQYSWTAVPVQFTLLKRIRR